MQDEEYSVYLKKQTYAELLSIRGSLDRVAFPVRYALVVAEVEAREVMADGRKGIMTATGILRPNRSMIAGLRAGCLVGVAFFIYASSQYSQTPQDPQKAIGYFFVALYSGIVGAVSFGSVFFGCSIPNVRHNRAKLLGVTLLSLTLATAAVLLVICSPK